jgi:Mrp family chromosome partitioning ATPase
MVMADIKRRLAIALEREHELHDTRLFLFTSVKAGAGVTGLAFEMALEFGDLGVKSVVVEVNPFRPDARYRDGRFQAGLLDLINGESTLEEAISSAKGVLPDRIGIGLPVNPHLYGYDTLREILARLKTRYPIVLLDAAPILFSADPEFLTAMADHTVLLVKARDVTTGELKRALSILEKQNPKAVSFVVTNLEIYQRGGYFANSNKEYNELSEKAKNTVRSLAQQKEDEIAAMKPVFYARCTAATFTARSEWRCTPWMGCAMPLRPCCWRRLAPPWRRRQDWAWRRSRSATHGSLPGSCAARSPDAAALLSRQPA